MVIIIGYPITIEAIIMNIKYLNNFGHFFKFFKLTLFNSGISILLQISCTKKKIKIYLK